MLARPHRHQGERTEPMTSTPPASLALVTGASSGIGAAMARELAARGHSVVLVARRAERLAALAAEISDRYDVAAIPLAADLAEAGVGERVLAALDGRPVNLLVNNAGLSIPDPFAATDWVRQRDCLMTLVMAVADLTHAVLPGMLARGEGRIITISSILALSQGGPGHTVYPAAKAFAHLFMLSLDAEVRPRGVICTSVLPGTTSSAFREANGIVLKPGGLASRMVQSPEAVARAAIEGNAKGHAIVIPGIHNRIAALAMKLAPDSLIRWAGQHAG